MATAQQCHALTTYFVSACKEAGTPVSINRNKARWGFEAILMDYTPGQARELVDYYIKHYEVPNLDWFLYNYDKVDEAKVERDKTRLRAKRLMAESEKRAEEWRNRWQQTKSE